MMRKQLNNYDGVLSTLKGNEEIELEDKEYKKIANEDVQKSDSKEKVELKVSENDNTAEDSKYNARWYNLGFLQSKLIKNIICCLSERQQIGGNIFILSINSISTALKSGLFFLISVYLELMMISSDLSLYTLLFKTGFLWTHGIFLLLLKV